MFWFPRDWITTRKSISIYLNWFKQTEMPLLDQAYYICIEYVIIKTCDLLAYNSVIMTFSSFHIKKCLKQQAINILGVSFLVVIAFIHPFVDIFFINNWTAFQINSMFNLYKNTHLIRCAWFILGGLFLMNLFQ